MVKRNLYIPKQGKLYVPCSTSACNNTPLNFQVRNAVACLEYNLRKDATANFSVECERCGQESKYNMDALLQMMDPDARPRPLPIGQKFVIILFEVNTTATMEDRAFFGERVLIKISDEKNGSWTGRTLRESQFAPSLNIGSEVCGGIFSGFYVCQYFLSSNEWIELPVKDMPKNSIFGLFFVPKEGNVTNLQCANLFCSNPSCENLFSLTYSELKKGIENHKGKLSTDPPLLAAGITEFTVLLGCELCGNSRVVDLESFDGLFKM